MDDLGGNHPYFWVDIHMKTMPWGSSFWPIHQKNLIRLPALDQNTQSRPIFEPKTADGYLPKVVETQEINRFSDFFFQLPKAFNSFMHQGDKHQNLTLSKSDFGSPRTSILSVPHRPWQIDQDLSSGQSRISEIHQPKMSKFWRKKKCTVYR